MKEIYLGLGGNIGNSRALVKAAVEAIQKIPGIYAFRASRLYETTPVSPIPQGNYINAVCTFHTELSANELLQTLQAIEASLGKIEKQKEAPRLIDIDILFYGVERIQDHDLEIPHPRWRERLFVLQPLSELAQEVTVPSKQPPYMPVKENVQTLIDTFHNIHEEVVTPIEE